MDEEDEGNEEDHPRATIEAGTRSTPAPMHSTPISPSSASLQSRSRPRPRFDYPIPQELEGVYRALGEDNWNEYLMLVEKNLLGEVTDEQCSAMASQVFFIEHQATQRKLHKQIVMTVVTPVVKQCAEAEKEGYP
jgi:hypothetical protein